MRSTKPLPSIPRIIITAVLIAAAILITHTATASGVREREISDTRYQERQEAIQELTAALEDMRDQNAELFRTISELQSRLEAVEFKADPNYPLSAELQEHAYYLCLRENVPYEHIRKIIWNESRCQSVGMVMDTNGLYSVGLMQINAVNWPKFEKMNVDVHTDKGNITAGIFLYAELRELYGPELAPVAYQCGPGKMQRKGITSTEYSRWILDDSQSVTDVL